MEKQRTRKPKTIQMKYPAPYSHSWASPPTDRTLGKSKKKIKKNSAVLQGNPVTGCCRRNRPRPLLSADPYAPHLKYGIFPQALKNRSQMETVSANATTRAALQPGVSSNHANNRGENKKMKQGDLSDAPLFVIRPIDKRHRRNLTVSEMLHLDIRPRRGLHSPPRKPSPLFRSAMPKMYPQY